MMGGLTLRRRDLEYLKSTCPRSIPTQPDLSRAVLNSGHWEISLRDKAIGGSSGIYVLDEDNFAAAVGTLVYKGAIGDAAAKMVFTDFSLLEDFWHEAYGTYCLVICKNGVLRLIPDRSGLYPLFRNDTQSIVSSSFLSVLESVKQPTVNPQALYEYVFQGASYDQRTVVDEVHALQRGATFRLDDCIHTETVPTNAWDAPLWEGFDHHIDLTVTALRREFQALREAFGNNIDTALSGGYDSRLVLSLLREQSVTPRVHVYGAANDPDVIIAKNISVGEGFELVHSDKGLEPAPTPERYSEVVAKNFLAFDGYPSDGIFDSGADLCTRYHRAAGGALALNGGGGEIFRNFFYLPDRNFTIRDIISGFFSQFDPIVGTKAFDEALYVTNLASTIARVLGLASSAPNVEATKLSRVQIEYLYPYLRCVYWMGRNNGVNNRIGFATTPFIEPALIQMALQIPISFKNHGIFEAALINKIDPALAAYPSTYGGNFSEPVSLNRKLKDYATILRPPLLRRLSYRIQNRRKSQSMPLVLTPEYLKRVIQPEFPLLRHYFNIAEVRSSLVMSRICTLEYLFEKFNVRAI